MTEPLDLMIREVVDLAEKGSARSTQKAIGPSEIGNPCDRAVAFKLAGVEPTNADRDNWLAVIGTAVHAWLADAFNAANRRLNRTRYLVEHRVNADGVEGTCDLLDTDTATVIDHKILGVTSLAEIRRGNIPPKYRTQLHVYGLGHIRAGRQVERVALAAYPRSDNLAGDFSGKGLHVWTEPYRPEIAHAALQRVNVLGGLIGSVPLEAVPASPGDDCRYCPFFRPGAPVDAYGCPGHAVGVPASLPGIC